jgi:hypothetical protein
LRVEWQHLQLGRFATNAIQSFLAVSLRITIVVKGQPYETQL